MPTLVITEGPLAGRTLVVEAELVLGRAGAGVDLEFDDDEVSRRHASVRPEDGRLLLRDLGSLNGTWVNGVRIADPCPLEPGDVIRLGASAIEVAPERAPAAAARPQPPPPTVGTPRSLVGRSFLDGRLVGAGLVAALVLQLLFTVSYIGASHDPRPHHVPVAIVGPPQAAAALARRIRAGGGALKPLPLTSRDALMRRIEHRSVYGGLVLGAKQDSLLVADAANLPVAGFLVDAFSRIEAKLGRPLLVTHVKPLPAGDSRGLTVFYLAVGWVFGGYLGATILSVLGGAAARGRRHAASRFGLLALYAVLSGVLGTVVAGPLVGALGGHRVAVAAIGMLLVLAVAATTAGFQALLGIGGTAVALVAFLIVGNPASGGSFAPELLPGFWRAVGGWLPPGLGVTSLRNTVYFGGTGMTRPLGVLAAYAVFGAALLVLAGWRRSSRASSAEIELAAAAAAV